MRDQKSAHLAALSLSGTFVARACSGCDRLCGDGYEGYGVAPRLGSETGQGRTARFFLCETCAEDLLLAFAGRHNLDIIPAPAPDAPDLCVQITFRPGDDPESAVVEMLPEPLYAEQELTCLGMAIRRLEAYRAAYSAALHADDDERNAEHAETRL